MKIWCSSFLFLGEEEEEYRNSDNSNLDIRYYFNFDNKGIEAMTEGTLGNGSKEVENDESELVFWEHFGDGSGGDRPGLGFQVDDERVNATENNEYFNFNSEFDKKSEDLLRWIDDLGSSSTGGGRESRGLNVDVNLNLGLGAESSSFSSTVVQGREDRSRDSQNKRPKVHSLSLDWGSHFENEIHYLSPVHEHVGDEDMPNSSSAGDSARNDSRGTLKFEDLEIPMDLTDDLLHMVFSFLNHIDLCRAAMVCRQWREASSHEDFWRYLNFKNRCISPQQLIVRNMAATRNQRRRERQRL